MIFRALTLGTSCVLLLRELWFLFIHIFFNKPISHSAMSELEFKIIRCPKVYPIREKFNLKRLKSTQRVYSPGVLSCGVHFLFCFLLRRIEDDKKFYCRSPEKNAASVHSGAAWNGLASGLTSCTQHRRCDWLSMWSSQWLRRWLSDASGNATTRWADRTVAWVPTWCLEAE